LLQSAFVNKRKKRQLYYKLTNHLTWEQKVTLRVLINSPQNASYFPLTDFIEDLEISDIIEGTNIKKQGRYRLAESYQYRFLLKPWACDYLRKHPECLKQDFAKLT